MTADLYAWHTATGSMVNGSVGGPPGGSPAQDLPRWTYASMLRKRDRARVVQLGHGCRKLTRGDHTWPARALCECVGRGK